MDSACGDDNDGVEDFGSVDSNGGDDANSGNGDSKFHCGGDLDGVSCDSNDNNDVADDRGVDSLILVMMLIVVAARAKLTAVKIQLVSK